MAMSYYYQTDVVKLIKNYLKSHPDSEDTLTGITNWWVKQQQFDDSLIAVNNALNELSAKGFISTVERNSTIYYKLVKNQIID